MLSPEKIAYIKSLEDSEGRLDIDELIAEARKKDNPCHDDFEWDTQKGMLTLWRMQARELIRKVHVETRLLGAGPTLVPCYVSDPASRHDHSRYANLLKMRDERVSAKAVVLDEMRRVLAALQRSAVVAGVLGFNIARALDAIADDVNELKSAVEVAAERKEKSKKKGRIPRPKSSARRHVSGGREVRQ